MKTFYITILAVAISATTLFSQGLDVRVYGGANVLQLSSDVGTTIIEGVVHSRTVTGRPGYQFGAAATYGKQFYIQPGFQYSVLSTKLVNKNIVKGNELTDETNINVISVPLKVGLRLIDPETEDIFNIRIFAGIEGNHVVSVDHKTKSGEIDDISTSDYSNLIMNADFGMGVDVLFFYLDMGYQLGLSPVHSGADKSTANSFYTNIGVRIKL